MSESIRWSVEAARDWYNRLPWLIGCNYNPRTAINQLEMWQEDSFDPKTIDQELGWAASIGMNSVRVFLHDLIWAQNKQDFLRRIEQFLEIAALHRIGVMLVFFDSCWHPCPHFGRQRDPEPGVHNSYWLQSPGVPVLRDEKQFDALHEYVTSVIHYFRNDSRVQVWDIWNEPENNNPSSRITRDIADKADLVARLMPRVFSWARAANPTQPLTSGIWHGDWSCDFTLKRCERVQLDESDVVSFHCYGPPDMLRAKIQQLLRYERPILCTEYMARGAGSTFAGSLPILREHHVGAYNWGLVQGKTQTHLPWNSWETPYTNGDPDPWFHEVFRPDGSAYNQAEIDLIQKVAGQAAQIKK